MCFCISTVTLPKASVSESMVVEADASDRVPIKLARVPVASTFCVFQQPHAVLSDPNEAEESLSRETVTVVLDTTGQLCMVHKNGGNSVAMDTFKACFDRASERTSQIAVLLLE